MMYNIEVQILKVCRDHPDLCAPDIERWLDIVHKSYVAEIRGQPPK
ncbi:MAG: hypothetical protein Q9P14_16885 [candidate division KSB1 bacterium]|nr:hypothetical protein [candidate division KSB1 bacterium]